MNPTPIAVSTSVVVNVLFAVAHIVRGVSIWSWFCYVDVLPFSTLIIALISLLPCVYSFDAGMDDYLMAFYSNFVHAASFYAFCLCVFM